MANINQPGTGVSAKAIPKHGPAWTFYLLTALAVLVVVATVLGFRFAGVAHWF